MWFSAAVVFLAPCSLLGLRIQQTLKWELAFRAAGDGTFRRRDCAWLNLAGTPAPEPAGGAPRERPGWAASAPALRAPARAARPPARTGRAPCPFKEQDRTTGTLFPGGGVLADSDNLN